jgi:hypothetical protein
VLDVVAHVFNPSYTGRRDRRKIMVL